MYRTPDGVAIGSVSTKVLDAMMGDGGMVLEEQIDREVAKFLIETKSDEVLLKTSVADLLTLKAGPYEVVVRAFINGLCTGGLTEAEALRRIAAKDEPELCLECVVIDETELPLENADRGSKVVTDFRDAWVWDGSKIVHDLPKARAIHMDRIRAVRNEELTKRDITFLRAVEAGDTDAQATIAAEKQTLRDTPQTFDITSNITTLPQLRDAWPIELPARY